MLTHINLYFIHMTHMKEKGKENVALLDITVYCSMTICRL